MLQVRRDCFNLASIDIKEISKHTTIAEMDHLAQIINRAYKTAETGLWKKGMTRTNGEEMMTFAESGELLGLYANDKLIGSVRLTQIDNQLGGIGMLAVDEAYHGHGYGKALIAAAENVWQRAGVDRIQMELLVAKSGHYPAKERLEKWYERIGYKAVERREVVDIFPPLANMLAVPSEFIIFQKEI